MKIGVALSGGKDSSLVAALLAREGHQVIGYHLLLSPAGYSAVPPEVQAETLRELVRRLEIEIRIIDGRQAFQAEIMETFARAYRDGQTPNPCIICNRLFKFGFLFEAARADGCERLASGHYARAVPGEQPLLKKPLPPRRDESYFLFDILPERLGQLLFPLGELAPGEARQLAGQLLGDFTPLPVSQEACFLSRTGLRRFLEDHQPGPGKPGEIVDSTGRVLGEHPGCHLYTVGQRKGLSSASGKSGPLYVRRIIPEENRVEVGGKEDLMARRLIAVRPNWLSIPPPEGRFAAQAKIRYTHPGAEALITPRDDGSLSVEFAAPQESPSPGQAAVFYRDDILLGGGWIQTVDR